MPAAPARDQTAKVQPMSISQLCQQPDSDDEMVKQDLDQDPLDLNSAEHNSVDHPHNLDSGRLYSSDEFEELDDSSRSSQRDADEQLAAEALGDMANAHTSSPGSNPAAPATPFISRMSSLPLVTSALKAYESGKQNSKVMKYGAEMVESGVKTLSKPVLDKLEPKLGQLDDFACRQLDKVYPTKSDLQALPSPTNSSRSSNDIHRPETGSNGQYHAYRSRRDSIDSTSSTNSSRPSFDVLRPRRHEDVTLRSRSDSQSSQRSFQYNGTNNGYYPQQQQQRQVASLSVSSSQQFTGWKGVVATVSTASAAGVAIFSEESMKSLKYCLQWLQYAVQHIDHQINLLRSFLVSLASPSQSTAMVPSTAATTLASIKQEVVETLRKVINVVSRYAGACLPDQAKISVRQFILSMPGRWASINNESVPSTPLASPTLGPKSDRSPEQQAQINETSQRATKVLVLAHESSDMLKSVASIFKDSVDKAENWMTKLRYVGMNPQNNSEGLPSWAPTGFPDTPAAAAAAAAAAMPGGFPGTSSGNSNGPSSTGLEQYSLRQTQQVNGSPRNLKGGFSHRHAYRQKSVMSGDEDSGSEDDDVPLAMDDSDDELGNGHSHGPLKRSMGSGPYTQDSAVRRRKKRGESAEEVAGLGQANGAESDAIKQESLN